MINLRIGDTVGDYEIVGEIGAGGMGMVFRVRNLISDRFEAMKVLLPTLADADVGDRFLREIKVHASLSHPNIARLHTALRYRDSYLMVMELIEGQSLAEAIRQGPLDPTTSVDLICQVLAALGYAHQHGVIHRDIKPANIMVQPDHVVKVTDFGIARSAVAARITATGFVLGSLYYMSPEQIKARPADERSDLYSVGATLYEIVTGRRPFEGASDYEIMKGHLEGAPTPPHQLQPSVRREISDAILRALAKDPADRFQTAQEFRSALVEFRPTTTEAQRTPLPAPAIPSDLAAIQAKLLPYLGPIAPRLIAKAATRTTSRATLVRELAAHIPDQDERDAFLSSCQAYLGQAEATARLSEPAISDPAHLDKVKQSLTRYIGPVAGMLVERTCKRATSRQEFYDALAKHIPSDKDRAEFLRSVQR
jgi:serine/threonine-protein kinase